METKTYKKYEVDLFVITQPEIDAGWQQTAKVWAENEADAAAFVLKETEAATSQLPTKLVAIRLVPHLTSNVNVLPAYEA